MAGNSVNSTTMWTPSAGYLGNAGQISPEEQARIDAANQAANQTSPYIQNGSVDYPGGNSPLNPQQFATQTEAERLAQMYGGTVSGDQLSGPGYGYVGPDGKPITQQQINVPGAPSPLNAGLVSGALSNNPGKYGQYSVGRDVTGDYGPSPYDTKVGNIAMGWSADGRYVPLSTSTAQNPVTAGAASAPGAGGAVRNSAPKGSIPFVAGAPLNTGSGASQRQPITGGGPPGGGAGGIQRPVIAGPGDPVTPPRDRIPSNDSEYTRGGGYEYPDPYYGEGDGGGSTTAPGGGQAHSGLGYAPSGTTRAPNTSYPNFVNQYPSPQSTNPYGYPGATQPMLSQMDTPEGENKGEGLQFKAEDDRRMAIQQGLGLQRDLSEYTGYQQGRANDYEGAANSAYGGIASGYGGYSDAEKGAIQNQGQLDAMQLSPEQQQQNYLTDEEKGNLQWVQDAEGNWTQSGTPGITGDPYAAYRQLGIDESQIDESTGQRGNRVREALASQESGVNQSLNNSSMAIRNATYDNRRKQYDNLSDIAALTRGQQGAAASNVRGALNYGEDTARDQQNQGASNVRGALNYGEDTTRQYIDPSKLALSDEYRQNYNFGERDIQNMRDKAARGIGSQSAMDEQRLLESANAAGNTSPMALAAERARIRQQSAVNSANAQSDAEIAAKRLQLDTTQQREATRLGAEGNIANLGTGTELALGGRRTAAETTLGAQGVQNEQLLGGRRTAAEQGIGTQGLSNEQYLGGETLGTQNTLGAAEQGAEQYLGNQTQQAEQFKGASRTGAEQTLGAAATEAEKFKTTTNLGAGQTAEKAQSDRASQIATNRQATSVGNQQSQLGRQQYQYGQTADNNTNFANQRMGNEAEYRNYLTGQGTQANQNAQVGTQQKLSAYGTQMGAQNAATGNAITNYKVPGAVEKILGGIFAKGGEVSGPTDALVGEEGAELIIDLEPTGYGEYGKPTEKLAGGGGPYDPYGQQDAYGMGQPDPYGANVMTGPRPSPQQLNPPNPFYEALRRGLIQPGSPNGLYPQDSAGAGGGSAGLGKQLTSGLISAGMKKLFPMAKGGVAVPGKSGHPFGKRGKSRTPHVKAELVTGPQVRTLGKYGAQAVLPLNRKKGNRVTPEMLPGLVHRYGG